MRRLYHVGFVVKDIKEAAKNFEDLLYPLSATRVIKDEIQRVYVCFVPIDTTSGVSIELIQPLDEKSPVYNFLLRGGGFYHICYIVDNIEAEISDLRKRGALLIAKPSEAAAFHGRRIAFLCYKENFIFELVEEKPNKERAG